MATLRLVIIAGLVNPMATLLRRPRTTLWKKMFVYIGVAIWPISSCLIRSTEIKHLVRSQVAAIDPVGAKTIAGVGPGVGRPINYVGEGEVVVFAI